MEFLGTAKTHPVDRGRFPGPVSHAYKADTGDILLSRDRPLVIIDNNNKRKGPKPRYIQIIVRANDDSAEKKILMAGANRVILPYVSAGIKVAQNITNPAMEDLMEITQDLDDSQMFQLAHVTIKKNSTLLNKTLRNCGIHRKGLLVVGISSRDKRIAFAPDADWVLKEGDCLIILTSRETLKETLESIET